MRTVYIARILDHEKCGDYNQSCKPGQLVLVPEAILRQNNGSTRFFLVTLTYADKKIRHTILRRKKIQTHYLSRASAQKIRKVLVLLKYFSSFFANFTATKDEKYFSSNNNYDNRN